MGIIKTDTSFIAGERNNRTPAYAEISKPLPELVTAEEALRLGGLDYHVELQEMVTVKGVTVPDTRAVVRTDTATAIGTVGSKYQPIQNRDSLAVLDSLVGPGKAYYECAGTLRGGAIAFVKLKLRDHITLPGQDVLEKHFLLYVSHDGTRTNRFVPCPVRVFCANQLPGIVSNPGLSIRHTASGPDRLKEAEGMLGYASKYFEKYGAFADKLIRTVMLERTLTEFVSHLFPVKDGKVIPPQTIRARERVIELFENGAGQHGGRNGTAWAALNAVAEYADHDRQTRTSDESARSALRAEAVWFGSGARLKERALEYLIDL